MDEVFGVPMSGVATVLVALLALCLLSVAWVAWRRPVIFKLGVRNIPRRRAQTTLIVVGLMLSTLITSAALGVGDTVDHSVTSEAYDLLGGIDELVVPSQEMDASIDLDTGTTIDQGVVQELDTALADNDNVDGVMPILFENVPVQNTAKGQSEPVVYLVGIDPARLDDFGGIRRVDGGEVDFAALQPNEVTLGEEAAKDLKAEVGDTVTVFYSNEAIDLTVAAITEESTLGGKVTFGVLGMAMPLANMQAMTGNDGQISLVAISNTGDARGGLDHSDAVNDDLSGVLEGMNLSNSAGLTLGIHDIKAETIDEVETGCPDLLRPVPRPRPLLGRRRRASHCPDLHDARRRAPLGDGHGARHRRATAVNSSSSSLPRARATPSSPAWSDRLWACSPLTASPRR